MGMVGEWCPRRAVSEFYGLNEVFRNGFSDRVQDPFEALENNRLDFLAAGWRNGKRRPRPLLRDMLLLKQLLRDPIDIDIG